MGPVVLIVSALAAGAAVGEAARRPIKDAYAGLKAIVHGEIPDTSESRIVGGGPSLPNRPAGVSMRAMLRAEMTQARVIKEQSIDQGSSEGPSWCDVYREGVRRVRVILTHVKDVHELTSIVSATAWGFDAEIVALSTESRFYDGKLNPFTGKPWKPDEFREAIAQGDLQDLGLLKRRILVMVADRHRRILVGSLAYSQSNVGAVWEGETIEPGGDPFSAEIYYLVRDVMSGPSATGTGPWLEHAHPMVQRALQDCATTRQLLDSPGAVIVLYSRTNEATRRVITESFAHGTPDRVYTRVV